MTPEFVFFVWLVLALFFAGIGAWVGVTNNREYAGAALGFLIGPFGVIAAAALQPSRYLVAVRHQNLAEVLVEALLAAQKADEGNDEDADDEWIETAELPEGLEVEAYAGMDEGFYVDPMDSSLERYWDGDTWDTETYPRRKHTRCPNVAV